MNYTLWMWLMISRWEQLVKFFPLMLMISSPISSSELLAGDPGEIKQYLFLCDRYFVTPDASSNRHINQNNCTQMHSINTLPAGRIIGNLLFSEQNCLSNPHHYYFVHLGKQEMSACTVSEFNACIYHWKFPIVGNNVKFINVIPILDEIDYYKQK